MEMIKNTEQTGPDGSIQTEFNVQNVTDINKVVEIINYFSNTYGEIGNISIKHTNAQGQYDFLGEYENAEHLLSTFRPEYNQFLQTVEFASLEQYVYFTIYPQENRLFVYDRTKPMGPKFYSSDPNVAKTYYTDDYGTIIRHNKNNGQFYSLGEDGNWIKNNYYYGKMLDGDLTQIEYNEGGRKL